MKHSLEKNIIALKEFQKDFLVIASSNMAQKEVYLRDNFPLLIDDLDFLIFLIENYPTKINLASRFFVERMISIRYYLASKGEAYVSFFTKNALSSWKKYYDFYLNFMLPLGDENGIVQKALDLCRDTYYLNLEVLEKNGTEIKDEWRSIETVSQNKLRTPSIRNMIEQNLFKEDGVGSDRLLYLYQLYSECCHPNSIMEKSGALESQGIFLIGILVSEVGDFMDFTKTVMKTSK